MKNNTPKMSVFVLIVALVGGAWLARQVARERRDQTVRVRHPLAGFNKFFSELSWIRLTQIRGRGQPVDQQQSAALLRKFEQITDLDPMFAQAYEQGAMDIAHTAPNDALALLDKALAVDKLKGWRLPFTAGFIASWRLHDYPRAVDYLERAARQADCPSHVRRMLINCKAQTVANNPAQVFDLWVDYYWGGTPDAAMGMLSMPGKIGAVHIPEGAYRSGRSLGGTSDDTALVLSRISNMAQDIISRAQADLKTADAAHQPELRARIEHITKTIREIYAQQHICSRCFRPYQAGDRFCVNDGTALEPYGLCRNGHVLRGSFCQVCGAPAK
jgi:hypothetical protein